MRRNLMRLLAALGLGCATASACAAEPRSVFLLIGQSNMAGRGLVEPRDREPIPGVLSLGPDDRWRPATDPLHWDKPELAGAGLARSFALGLLAARPGAAIGLVPAAVGGSSLDEWRPDGPLYTEALRRARVALADGGRLRGILWHQGEAESTDAKRAATYTERWLPLIARLRADLHAPDVPVIVGQLGVFAPGYVSGDGFRRHLHVAAVDRSLALLPLHCPRVAFVPSEGLTDKGDSLHFDTPSLRELGRRYAHAYLLLDSAWTPPAPDAAVDRLSSRRGRNHR